MDEKRPRDDSPDTVHHTSLLKRLKYEAGINSCTYGGRRKGKAQTLGSFLLERFSYFGEEEWKRRINKGMLTILEHEEETKWESVLRGGQKIVLETLREEEPDVDLAYSVLSRSTTTDLDAVAIEKNGNIPVTQSGKYKKNTLYFELLDSLKEPVWPVHRLDKETSGCVVFATSEEAAAQISRVIRSGDLIKEYVAVLIGHMTEETIVERSIGPAWKERPSDYCSDCPAMKRIRQVVTPNGKSCKTVYTPIKYNSGLTLVKIKLYQGRTHQIRVHAEYLGMPVLGDKVYGHGDSSERQSLRWIKEQDLMLTPYGAITRHLLHSARIKFPFGWEIKSDPKPFFMKFPCCAELFSNTAEPSEKKEIKTED